MTISEIQSWAWLPTEPQFPIACSHISTYQTGVVSNSNRVVFRSWFRCIWSGFFQNIPQPWNKKKNQSMFRFSKGKGKFFAPDSHHCWYDRIERHASFWWNNPCNLPEATWKFLPLLWTLPCPHYGQAASAVTQINRKCYKTQWLVKIDGIQCLPVQLFVVFEDTGCTCNRFLKMNAF
jgi:hypothetical protein